MKNKIAKLHVRNMIRAVIMCIVAVFMLGGIASIGGTVSSMLTFKRFYNGNFQRSNTQLEVREDLQILGKHTLWVITDTSNPERRALHQSYADEAYEHIDHHLSELEETYKGIPEITAIRTDWEKIKVSYAVVQEAITNSDILTAILTFTGEMEDTSLNMQEKLTALGDATEKEAIVAYKTSTIANAGSIAFLVAVVAVSVAFGLKQTNLLTGLLVPPIIELQEASAKLANGDLDINIEYDADNELGDLARAFRTTCHQMEGMIQDLTFVLDGLKDGNFNVKSADHSLYTGDFQKLIWDVEATARKQSDTLMQINDTVGQVALGAEQLAASATDIAEGASNQERAIKALSGNVENITQISTQSTESAITTVENIKHAVNKAEQGKTEVSALNGAMERITSTSREIEKIIATIEDIASQTNLLSLNASIEAARAGDAGRGFAVVAEQIGKLAQDSAKAAVQTRDLISKSINEIEDGSKIVANATEIITETIGNMEHFEVTASHMADAFKQQSDMLKNIERDIAQISDVVENNSATSEETSAVSEELSAQAEQLGNLTGQFTFRDE